MITDRHIRNSVLTVLTILISVSVFSGYSYAKATASVKQKAYASPSEAVQALVTSVRSGDDRQLRAILGKGSDDLISSGDSVDDKTARERFLKAYDEKNMLEMKDDNKALLHIGVQDRVFAIPVVRKGQTWKFDTEAGREELLCRRIGRNELSVMDVLQAYADAQREYASKDQDKDGPPGFAQRLISTKGKKDGLFWAAEDGGEESPLGPLIAKAADEGYKDSSKMEPYHGYYFRILKAQGPNAKGGAFDYVVNGKMVLGFGLVAYPAKYGSSGVMTFVVNQEGVIYQKDMGRGTVRAAKMKTFDPDKTWEKVKQADMK